MILVNIVRYPGDRTRESGDVLALISMLLHCQISQLITYAGGGGGGRGRRDENSGPTRQIFKKLLNKNAIKAKIGEAPR